VENICCIRTEGGCYNQLSFSCAIVLTLLDVPHDITGEDTSTPRTYRVISVDRLKENK
jgi:hypothetical protein